MCNIVYNNTYGKTTQHATSRRITRSQTSNREQYYRLRGKSNSRKFLEQVEADFNDDNGSAGGES